MFLSLRSAHGIVEESCDCGVLSAGAVGGGGGGVRAVLQIQERYRDVQSFSESGLLCVKANFPPTTSSCSPSHLSSLIVGKREAAAELSV